MTPWLIPTGSGERAVADFMAAWLSDLPVEVTFDEIEPGRINLIARLRGTGGGPILGINAHADTVGYANWADRALTPRWRAIGWSASAWRTTRAGAPQGCWRSVRSWSPACG